MALIFQEREIAVAVSTNASQFSLMYCSLFFVQFNNLQAPDKSILGDCSSFHEELNALRILSHKTINTTNSNESKSFLNLTAVFLSCVFSEVKDIRVKTFKMCITISNGTYCINFRTPSGRAEVFQGKRILVTLDLNF